MNKKIKNLMGLLVFFFLAIFSINSASAYHAVYDDKKSFKDDKELTSVMIDRDVTNIKEGAFRGCTNLKEIEFSSNVTSIGYSAFMHCESLTSINIPEGVTRIGSSVFYDCGSLTLVTISNSVTSIGEFAFGDCYKLKKVIIPRRFANKIITTFRYTFSIIEAINKIEINYTD